MLHTHHLADPRVPYQLHQLSLNHHYLVWQRQVRERNLYYPLSYLYLILEASIGSIQTVDSVRPDSHQTVKKNTKIHSTCVLWMQKGRMDRWIVYTLFKFISEKFPCKAVMESWPLKYSLLVLLICVAAGWGFGCKACCCFMYIACCAFIWFCRFCICCLYLAMASIVLPLLPLRANDCWAP